MLQTKTVDVLRHEVKTNGCVFISVALAEV